MDFIISKMDFVPQPEDAKKFPSIRWLKWHLYKYPHVFIVFSPVPYIIYKYTEIFFTYKRAYANGTYVPNAVKNRYAICRSDDWLAQTTPSRYKN